MEEVKINGQSTSAQMSNKNGMDFVTVVSVGSEDVPQSKIDQEASAGDGQHNSGYVTVLTIGESNNQPKEIIEEVLVYRLPGERLGFGLKFEGGTKAAEFVKRLFIQSCAPDSPASMVHCSWGKLTEGDEVLNIDSLPVTSMTRIDCVRCLKDSNVVIKLLVRHFVNNKSSDDKEDSNDSSARVTEDLPLVIGAEKKRTPPPPPPVPPRKIPRKMLKDHLFVNNATPVPDTDSSTPYQNNEPVVNGNRNARFQSPRSSGRFAHSRQSPEVSRHVYRDRRLSDGSIGPPDAEVYLDLFSQEAGCNLSESDDTGSSISTIIDRFSSFPTTTNSSFAGSLPSTPTFIQKHLDVSSILNPLDKNELDGDNYLFTKLVSSQNGIDEPDSPNSLKNDDECTEKPNKNEVASEEGTPLQPPTNFQDAPLSYGNEDVGVVEASVKISVKDISKYQEAEIEDENGNCLKDLHINKMVNKTENLTYYRTENEVKKRPPPPPPPCEKPPTMPKDSKDNVTNGDTLNEVDLPRLVHFVPKFNKQQGSENQCDEASNTIESVKLFLENEIRTSKEMSFIGDIDGMDENGCILDSSRPDIYNSELYNLSWSLSPQLATIGEDDEDGCHDSFTQKSTSTCTPIVIIENADTDRKEIENLQISERTDEPDGAGNISTDDDADKPGEEEGLQPEDTVTLDVSSADLCETMDAPPSSSRQPPDGDEFPDYHEATVTPKTSKLEDSSNKLPPSWINNTLWKTNSTSLFRDQQSSCSVRDKIAIFSNTPSKPAPSCDLKKVYKSTDDILTAVEKERLEKNKAFSKFTNPVNKVKRSASTLCKTIVDPIFQPKEKTNSAFESSRARSSLDLTFETSHARFPSEEKYDDGLEKHTPQPRLHTRSQSLLDVSSTDSYKKDRWNLLAEQRQKSLSKLKGLIIPERVVEVDVPAVVDLPEIKSSNVPSEIAKNAVTSSTQHEMPIVPCQRNVQIPCLTTPPWSSNNSSNVPKYSPAFKRKSLQVHSNSSKIDISSNDGSCHKTSAVEDVESVLTKLDQKELPHKSQTDLYDTNQDSKITGNLCLSDAPKSLESITSPTRSDCSFEYVSSSPDIKPNQQESSHKAQLDTRIGLYNLPKGKEDIGRSEDESDNDSAVSSSQSSYISRTSPPTSPSHLHSNFTSRTCSINESDSLVQLKCHSTGSQPHSQSGDNQNHRLLKPQSVEAINRKNILASAKCRSGRDLKIGSPLIQRKFEEESVVSSNASQVSVNNAELNYNAKYLQRCTTIYEKANDAPLDVKPDSDMMQSETSLKEEDRLFVNSKVDCANSSGTQRWMRSETKVITEQKIGTNENGIKSYSVNTTVAVANNEITFTKKNNIIKDDTPVSKEPIAVDLTNNKEQKVPISRRYTKDVRAASVTDLRKSFEKLAPVQPTPSLPNANVNKSNSSSSAIKSNHVQERRVSNTEAPFKQETQIDAATVNFDKSKYKDVELIVLRPEIPGGSVGITLAGGADYETKEITVHKIRGESSAHRDGRLQKGDTVISINGKSVEGLTHKQLVALLKEPLPEVTLAICRQKESSTSSELLSPRSNASASVAPPKEKEKVPSPNKQKTMLVSLMKDASGLGLSLEGGQDSPLGNMPLLIKKIFKGGAADKCGKLQVGDELQLVNETDVSSMSRFEAWSVLKKLPEGITISLTIRR